MLSRHPHTDSADTYKKDRRSDKERRTTSDRRNLFRFEDLMNDRRAGILRRNTDFSWEQKFYIETD